MNFFNDIGRAFQSAGQTINNEVIKPAENTLNPKNTGMINALDPNKNGFTNAFSNLDPKKNGLKIALDNLENHMQKLDPNKTGASNAFNPHKNGFVNALDPKKIETQINKELNKISPTLNLPPPIPQPKNLQDIMKELENKIINPSQKISNDIKKGFEKEIIAPSQKISNDIKTGFEKDIIDGFKKDIIDGFKKDIIDGFQRDIIQGFERDVINPSKTIFDAFNQGVGQQTKPNNNYASDTDLLIYGGLALLVAFVLLK